MANKPPAFQFYVKDWLSSESVVTMSAEQRGWYIQLLCHAWNGDPIASLPTEDGKLKALAGAGDSWASDKQAVLECFELENGRFVNRKLAAQYQDLVAYHSKQRENGQKGARSRWEKGDGGAMGTPMANAGPATATASSAPTASSSSASVNGSGSYSSAEQADTASQTGQEDQKRISRAVRIGLEYIGSTQGQKALLLTPEQYAGEEQVLLLAQDETPERFIKIAEVLRWAQMQSNFWYRDPKGFVVSPKNIRKVEEQYDRFYAKVPLNKKPHILCPLNHEFGIVPIFENEETTAPNPTAYIGGDENAPADCSKAFEIED
jgi:uncharacterized protein YdaU (DUF1376 family)